MPVKFKWVMKNSKGLVLERSVEAPGRIQYLAFASESTTESREVLDVTIKIPVHAAGPGGADVLQHIQLLIEACLDGQIEIENREFVQDGVPAFTRCGPPEL